MHLAVLTDAPSFALLCELRTCAGRRPATSCVPPFASRAAGRRGVTGDRAAVDAVRGKHAKYSEAGGAFAVEDDGRRGPQAQAFLPLCCGGPAPGDRVHP